MPANCSADVQAVIEHVDSVFLNGTDDEITALKDNFGLGAVTHLDDAAGACKASTFITVNTNVLTNFKCATISGSGKVSLLIPDRMRPSTSSVTLWKLKMELRRVPAGGDSTML